MPAETTVGRVQPLPLPLTNLIGREADVAAAVALARRADVRLVTFIGPGGTGKTRLATEVATQLTAYFADGVCFVDLAPIRDPDLVVATIGQTLGLHDESDGTALHDLIAHLRDWKLLVLVDNFEQVVGAAPLLTDLLRACPDVKIAATSRTPLGVSGEQLFPVAPLALPERTQQPSLDQLGAYASIQLFVERARAARADFALTEANAPSVSAICRRLDGLPLAIELAATWIRMLTPADLLDRLAQRLPLLTGGPRDRPARQQTLRDTIAWSHDLLTGDQQTLFRRLAVSVGGFTPEAATAVAEIDPPGAALLSPHNLLADLVSLADHHLIRPADHQDGEARFTFLETVREYALEQLASSSDHDATRSAHATYYLHLAEQGEIGLAGADQATWMTRLESDHDNLRAALRWSIESADAETALRLGAALWPFWAPSGHLREGQVWLERALALGGTVASAARVKALRRLGNLANDLADFPRARDYYQASLELARDLGDQDAIANALTGLGLIALGQGDYAEARSCHEESLALWQTLNQKRGIARAMHNLGHTASSEGSYEQARAMHMAALDLRRELDDVGGIAYSLMLLGRVARQEGHLKEAVGWLRQSQPIFHEVGDQHGIAYVLNELGRVAHQQRDNHQAASCHHEALTIRRDLQAAQGIVASIEGIAAVACSQGESGSGVRLIGSADAWRAAHDAPLPRADHAERDRTLARARAALGAAPFSEALTIGQAMTFDQAIDAAATVATQVIARSMPGQPAAPAVIATLTPRERQVLCQIATGQSNAEIADTLYLSTRTVSTHVTSILGKLEMSSRTQAAAFAVRQGLC